MSENRRVDLSRRSFVGAGALALGGLPFAPSVVRAAPKSSLKLSIFTTPANGATQELQRWADALRAETGGELDVALFPSSQMGPPARQYDLARSGVADLAWVLHGFTPGRFPLTEIAYLPGLFPDAERGAQALLRALPTHLAREHEGTRVLAITANPRLKILTNSLAIRTLDDLRGRRLRHPGAAIADTLTSLGASPVAVPPAEMGEAISRGVVDGLVTSYEAAASFKIFDALKYSTDVNLGMVTFALVINNESYAKLPPPLRAVLDANTGAGLSQRLAAGFEAMEADAIASTAGRIAQVEVPGPERERFAAAFGKVRDAKLNSLEAKGLPARKVFEELRAGSL